VFVVDSLTTNQVRRSHVLRLLLATALPSLLSCDGTITVDGMVLTASGLERSQVYIDTPAPELAEATPLDSVLVDIIENPSNQEPNAMGHGSDTTKSDGKFHYFAVTCPCEFDVKIGIRRSGYEEIERIFRHGMQDHRIVIHLARKRP
jgi:hypothetical protein